MMDQEAYVLCPPSLHMPLPSLCLHTLQLFQGRLPSSVMYLMSRQYAQAQHAQAVRACMHLGGQSIAFCCDYQLLPAPLSAPAVNFAVSLQRRSTSEADATARLEADAAHSDATATSSPPEMGIQMPSNLILMVLVCNLVISVPPGPTRRSCF